MGDLMPFTFVPSTEHLDFPMEMWTEVQLLDEFYKANILLDFEQKEVAQMRAGHAGSMALAKACGPFLVVDPKDEVIQRLGQQLAAEKKLAEHYRDMLLHERSLYTRSTGPR